MLGNPHFYHRSIRKMVVTFGTLFNDLEIVRFTSTGEPKERFKVPLTYGPKEKYIIRGQSDPTLTKSVATVIPRMSFNLDSLSYDSSRKQVTTLKNFSSYGDAVNAQYVPVPFNFEFTLSILTRNTEDGTQILEQILPFFTPDFTVTIDFIQSMNQVFDVPIILKSVTSNVDYEGNFDSSRVIIWDINFTAKGFIWPPVSSTGFIRQANTSISTDMTGQSIPLVSIKTTPNPIDAEPDDEYGFIDTITENPYE